MALSSFERRTLFKEGETIADASVYGGDASRVPLVAGDKVDVFLPKDNAPRLTARVVYTWPVRAPVKPDQTIGTLRISNDRQVLREVPVKTAGTVGVGTLRSRALDALKQVRERQRFMKGLFTWVGYRQLPVVYHRDPRHAGETKWNYWRLWNFAIDGITSFSGAPLKLATYIGLATAALAFVFGLWVLGKALVFGDPVRGYPSLMVVVLLLGGVQLVALGVIGEYLGRLYVESKQRPLYLVDEYHPPHGGG